MTWDARPPDETLLALLDTTRQRGIRLLAAGDQLRFQAPPGAMNEGLRAALSARREGVLAFLRDAGGSASLPVPARVGPDPLSAGQLHLWMLEDQGSVGATYHLPMLMRFDRPCPTDRLAEALRLIVGRHPSLRTVFPRLGELPIAVTLPGEATVAVEIASSIDDLEMIARRRFDLVAGPLFRAAAATHPDGTDLLLVAHHIVADGRSMMLIAAELLDLLNARPLADPPKWTFADFARWQADPEQCAGASRALDQLAPMYDGAEDLTPLPTDRARPQVQDFAGGWLDLRIEPAVVGAVERLAAERRVSFNAVLAASFASVLARASGRLELTFGIVDAGRPFHEVENVVGNFANLLPVHIRLAPADRFDARVDGAAVALRQLQLYAAIPFSLFVNRFARNRGAGFNPLAQHVLVLNDFPVPVSGPGELGAEIRPLPLGVSRFDTMLSLRRGADGLDGALEFASAFFDASRMKLFADRFAGLLAAGVSDPACQVAALDRQVMQAYGSASVLSATPTKPTSATAPATILGVCAERPTALAVTDGACRLSYGELAHQSALIAAALERRGLPPGALIGLWCGRSALLLPAILGIWRAGQA